MKRIVLSIGIVVLTLFLSSCSVGSDYVKDLEARVSELESENAILKEQAAALDTQAASADDAATEQVAVDIVLGEQFVCGDVMELTLNSVNWEEAIYPTSTNYLSHIADNEGEKYLCIRGSLTNKSSISVNPQYTSDITFHINDEYKQIGTVVLESADGTKFNSPIKPLQTLNMVVYVSVSDALYEQCESVRMDMKLVNNDAELEYYYEEGFSTDLFVLNINSIEK